MKVLHIISNLGVGGAETMLKRLVESDPVSILHTVIVSLTTLGVIGELLRNQGVKVHTLNLSSNGLNLPMVLWRLILLIRRFKPDIVQTWLYHADLLGGLAARLAGSKNIVWGVRCTAIPQGALSITYWLVRLCGILSHTVPDRIICCAISAREVHINLRYAAHKMTVVPNGYDFSAFEMQSTSRKNVRQELGIKADDIVIGVVGRFDPLKDFHNFVSAASYIATKRADVKFLMVGDGNEWTNSVLHGWIEEAGLLNRFCLVGYQAEVAQFFSAMDIFCLSSQNEGFPNVLVEAMAMSLPCVVTQAGDATDILGDDDFVVPVKDSVSLANALLQMCQLDSDEQRLLGEKNAEKVRYQYGIEEVRRKYKAIYEEINR